MAEPPVNGKDFTVGMRLLKWLTLAPVKPTFI
jgi:hypothetical protein